MLDGTKIDGLVDLRTYLLTQRKDQFLRYFLLKLASVFLLGRGVHLSDQPLVDEMLVADPHDYRFSAAVDTIVRSQQFRYHRAVGVVNDQS